MSILSVPGDLWRLLRVGATFARTGALVRIVEQVEPPAYAGWVLRALAAPLSPFGLKGDPSLPPIPRAIQALGPAYIKFGQILSTRPDVTGPDLSKELRFLQDRLPAFADAEARRAIRLELGADADAIFAEFQPPVAAASIAQVHPAVDRATGARVAVKVLRPGVERQFRKDISAFYFIAGLLELLLPSAKRLRPRAVVDHFNGVVTGEMDLRMEAAAASRFLDNTAGDEGFRVPAIYWEQTAKRVMTMEWVDGAHVGDPDALAAAGHDLPRLAERILQVFLLHALRDGYFHADMHQGNLKIGPDGEIRALDFGIMGRLDLLTRRYYAEILYGFLQRDYHRVAEVHFEAGYVPADQDVELFAQALRSIGEPIFGQAASSISMARLLAHLFEVTERFGMRTQTQLILLQRTMVVVEGVARSIDPNANIWTAAKPVVEDYIRSNLGPKALAKDLGRAALALARIAPRLPEIAEQIARRAQQGDPPPAPRAPRWKAALLGLLVGAGGVWTLLHVLG